MRVRLHETFLKYVLGILVILSDVLGETVDLTLVSFYEFAEGTRVASTRGFNKRKLISLFYAHLNMIR